MLEYFVMYCIKKTNRILHCIALFLLSLCLGNSWLYAENKCCFCQEIIELFKAEQCIDKKALEELIKNRNEEANNHYAIRLEAMSEIYSSLVPEYRCYQDKFYFRFLPILKNNSFSREEIINYQIVGFDKLFEIPCSIL